LKIDPTIGRDAEPDSTPVVRKRRPHLPPIAGVTTRVTVDVPVDDHRALKRSVDEVADALGLTNVAVGRVMATLAHQVAHDTGLRDSVIAYLRERVEQ